MLTATTVIRRFRILNIALLIILILVLRWAGLLIPLAYSWQYAIVTTGAILILAMVSLASFRIMIVGQLKNKLNADLYYKITSDRAMLLRSTTYHLDGALWSGDYAKAADIAAAMPKYTMSPNKKAYAAVCLAHAYFETANYDKLAEACSAFASIYSCRAKRKDQAYIDYYRAFLCGDFAACIKAVNKAGKGKTGKARRLFLSGIAKMKSGDEAGAQSDFARLGRLSKNINISRIAAGVTSVTKAEPTDLDAHAGYERVHKDETVKRTIAALIVAVLLAAHLSYCINKMLEYQSILDSAHEVQGHLLGYYYKGEDEEIVDFYVKWNGKFVFTVFLAEDDDRNINVYFVRTGKYGEYIYDLMFERIKPGETYKKDATTDDGRSVKVTAKLLAEGETSDGTEAKAMKFRFHGTDYTLCIFVEE